MRAPTCFVFSACYLTVVADGCEVCKQISGWDVAVSGDYVVSGCYGSTSVAGKVEFFERNPVDGSEQWGFIASRSATSCSNPPSCTTQSDVSAAGDFFGYSVDISGSTAIVGSFGVTTKTGAAYIFERGFDTVFDGTTSNMWRLSKVLVAPDAATNSFFGFSVALDGSYALVTSLKANDGKGYLFARNYGGLNNWGYVKAISQPAIGAGALDYTGNAGAKHSVNYWSDGSGTAARTDGEQLQHKAPYYGDYAITSTAASANFGASAVISGNTVAIGAPFADVTTDDIGAISLVQINPTWRQTPPRHMEQTLSGADTMAGDRYGASLHITADNRYAVVGAPSACVSEKTDSGATYLLSRSANMQFTQYTKLVPDDPEDFAYFGECNWFTETFSLLPKFLLKKLLVRAIWLIQTPIFRSPPTHRTLRRNGCELCRPPPQRSNGICAGGGVGWCTGKDQHRLSCLPHAEPGYSNAIRIRCRICLCSAAELHVHKTCSCHHSSASGHKFKSDDYCNIGDRSARGLDLGIHYDRHERGHVRHGC